MKMLASITLLAPPSTQDVPLLTELRAVAELSYKHDAPSGAAQKANSTGNSEGFPEPPCLFTSTSAAYFRQRFAIR